MLGVHPVAHEAFPRRTLALGNFIFVVRKREIDSTGVNVQGLTKIFHGHRRTFDVPTRAALTDGRLPEMLAGLWCFPKSKVSCALFFVAIDIDARAGLNSCHVNI